MYILFLPIYLIFSSFLASQDMGFDWPVGKETIVHRLTSLFGESRGDHFHNGVDISSDNEAVGSIGNGKILYSRYNSDDPYRSEFGTGNCVWVYHGKGVASAYYHLKDGREIGDKRDIKRGEILGKTGNTGHSSGSHLHFIIATLFGKKIVNPLPMLPDVPDSSSPKIGTLILTIGEKYSYVNDGDNINISRAFPVTVQILDSGSNTGQRRGVKAVQFFHNKKLVKESRFTEISLLNNAWVNEDGLPFSELFFEGNYYIGNLNLVSGENIIEVHATDFHGNETTKKISFNVTRI
jgi:hypothetical protein